MARTLRHMPDSHTLFEITSRTIHGRFLMRPSKEANDLILGVLGRAQSLYPGVALYLFVFMSNHYEMLASAETYDEVAAFIGHINSNIARELGRLHDWREKFWGRRYYAIPVIDEVGLFKRVDYILRHGSKENLVWRPEDWPGVNCVAAITRGQRLFGTWIDRAGLYRASRKCDGSGTIDPDDFAIRYEVKLTPLPCWADREEAWRQAQFRDLIRTIEQDARARHAQEGSTPKGPKHVRAQDPHDRPEHSKRSPAPRCHAGSRKTRRWYQRLYKAFVEAYKIASERLRAGHLDVEFPMHCFPPALSYRRPDTRSIRGWAMAPG